MSLLELTRFEKEKLKEFRSRVDHLLIREEYKEDHFLIRWLLARDMDLDKAHEMLEKSIKWRQEAKADGILDRKEEDFPLKYQKRFMCGHFGEDKEGYPIVLLPGGRHDHRLVLEEYGLDSFLRWNIVWIEKIMKFIDDARKKTGKPIFQYHEILDLEGYSIRQLSHKPSIEYLLKTQQFFDTNYPEIVKSITIINAPKVFPILFALFKPLLSKQTLDKINVFGSDESKWKEFFREKFPMENFPSRWGGALKGSDEFCSQEPIWIGSPIPLRYFKIVEGDDEEGFKTVKVGARDKFKVKMEIPKKGTELRWQFETEVHDIAFGLSVQNDGIEIPVSRVASNKEMQHGSFIAKSSGKVTFVFDNKFSYTTPKVLRYRIELIQPGGKESGSNSNSKAEEAEEKCGKNIKDTVQISGDIVNESSLNSTLYPSLPQDVIIS